MRIAAPAFPTDRIVSDARFSHGGKTCAGDDARHRRAGSQRSASRCGGDRVAAREHCCQVGVRRVSVSRLTAVSPGTGLTSAAVGWS